MISLLIFCAQSKNSTYYTAINATDRAKCSIDDPCSFKTILQTVVHTDLVVFNDTYIIQNLDLIEFQFTVNTLIEKGVRIQGSDQITIINGTFLRPKTDYFIIARDGCKLFYFANFEFTNFKYPVMVINGVNNSLLTNITFKKNMLDNNFCIALWTVSYLTIDNIVFSENAVNYTAVLFVSTAVVNGTNFTFERNYGEHLGHDCLLRLLNTFFLVDNTTIRDNSAGDSPLAFMDCRAGLYLQNFVLERNYHPELFLCDGKCNFSFINAVIQGNRGVIIETTGEAYAEIVNSTVLNNFSPNEPLFYIPGGVVGLENNTMISGNHGRCFVDMTDDKSQIYVQNSSFLQNSFDEYSFGCGDNGNITLRNVTISKDFAPQGSFRVHQGLFDVDNITSTYNFGSLLNLTSGNLSLLNSHFSYEKDIELYFTENATYIGVNNTFANQFIPEESHISLNRTETQSPENPEPSEL